LVVKVSPVIARTVLHAARRAATPPAAPARRGRVRARPRRVRTLLPGSGGAAGFGRCCRVRAVLTGSGGAAGFGRCWRVLAVLTVSGGAAGFGGCWRPGRPDRVGHSRNGHL